MRDSSTHDDALKFLNSLRFEAGLILREAQISFPFSYNAFFQFLILNHRVDAIKYLRANFRMDADSALIPNVTPREVQEALNTLAAAGYEFTATPPGNHVGLKEAKDFVEVICAAINSYVHPDLGIERCIDVANELDPLQDSLQEAFMEGMGQL